MDALLTAGGIPGPDDPLYQYTQGKPKALVEIAGKPMVQWVLDALSESQTIDQVVIIGITEESGVTCAKPLTFTPSQGGMLDNVQGGVKKVAEVNPQSKRILIVSSDIPAITGEIVDWTVNKAQKTDHDLYYNVVEQEVMEKRFPGANRTYIKLKDGNVCGSDMNVIATHIVTANEEMWERLSESRKSIIKQASLIGFDTLLLLLLRRLTLQQGIVKVTKRLNLSGDSIKTPYAETAMDVDKPHQFEIIQKDLLQRETA